ncbi:MAG: AAA family ATPase [bacterium]
MPPSSSHIVAFPPFALDLRAGSLLRDGVALNLRPKTFAVLVYLAQHPGELVTKHALLDAVWGDVAVTEDVARLSVGELRTALGDQRQAPRCIETVPRRGYRFIATIGGAAGDRTALEAESNALAPVGRQRELTTVLEWLAQARDGRRQIAFISGEAGIGKTTLVDAVLQELARAGSQWRVARGQCVEHFGGGEPYLPVLDALSGLCRGTDATGVRPTLTETAPGWMLAILDAPVAGGGAAPHEATHEHTLHKLATTLEALATERPLLVVFEDVQWSDYATLDLLSVLAQRRTPASLAILCTLRPSDAIASGHPVAGVRRELMRKELCREIILDGLPACDVAEYLTRRFDGVGLPDELLPLLMERTEGNPFFIGVLIDDLLERVLLTRRDAGWQLHGGTDALRSSIPEGLRAVIEPRLERLADAERRLIEAASILGFEFPAHAITAIAPDDADLGDVEAVEALCDGLARRQLILRAAGESAWPDGRWSARYAFRHALYRQVVSQRIAPSMRRRLHQAAGESLETAYGPRTPEVASQMAAHFERSRDVDRAIRYHDQAAHHAGSRNANEEAIAHLRRALTLLATVPATRERDERELRLQAAIGAPLTAVRGWSHPENEQAYARARELAARIGAAPDLPRVLAGLADAYLVKGEFATSAEVAREALAVAERTGEALDLLSAHCQTGMPLFFQGDFASALRHLEHAADLYDPAAHAALAYSTGIDRGINSRGYAALCHLYIGHLDRALAVSEAAVVLARQVRHPLSLAQALFLAGFTHFTRGDLTRTRERVDEVVALAGELGFPLYLAVGTFLRGRVRIESDDCDVGLAEMQQAIVELAQISSGLAAPQFLGLLAGGLHKAGRHDEALQALGLGVAQADTQGQHYYDAELHRLRADILLDTESQPPDDAAALYAQALEIARRQQARLFELRAAIGMARLWQRHGKRTAARALLTPVYAGFAEGVDTQDLRAARQLLAELAT